ncbi:MAG: hypothetical protein ABI885_24275 [Gammaproteobacteria bacterium]
MSTTDHEAQANERIRLAITRWNAARAAKDAASRNEPSREVWRAVSQTESDARIEYAAALLAKGLSVPHNLLADIDRQFWPSGYEGFNE